METAFRPDEILGFLGPIEAKNAPEALFVAGDTSLLNEGTRVSVVGARKATEDGKKRARALVLALVEQGITVVSGLAEGIDTIAHQTAIEAGGRTIAVLGTPLSEAYPAKNRELLEIIKRDHLAVSQFPEGYPTRGENFPRRNRTMALISDATIVVEANEKSGTRHQGWEAIRLGRLVYLLENVVMKQGMTWPKELLAYGAQVLRREDLPNLRYDIPNFTSGGGSAF